MTRWRLDQVIDDYRDANPASARLAETAKQSFPGGSTRSTSYFQPFPVYLERADGVYVWDVDGNRLIDFNTNFGTTIHGHGFPSIVQALADQAPHGISFAAATPGEIKLAELIKQRLPSIETLRLTSSGSEAVCLAIRAARAYTGRTKIAKCSGGYHGSSPIGTISGPGTIPCEEGLPTENAVADGPGLTASDLADLVTLPFNQSKSTATVLVEIGPDLAAVIVEPVQGAAGLIPAASAYLETLRRETQRHGTLLIFDEVMMFRLSFNGAQGVYGIKPDLTVLGKVIGGGLPVGAVGGRRDVMSVFDITQLNSVRHAGTYNANPMTTAAGIAALESLTPEAFARMRELTDCLYLAAKDLFSFYQIPASVAVAENFFCLQALRRSACDHGELSRQDQNLFRALHLGLINTGVFLTPVGMGCLSTTMDSSHVEEFLNALTTVIERYLR